MKKFLVIGNPIEHSLSPKLHNYWIKKNNLDAIYAKLEAHENDLSEFQISGQMDAQMLKPQEGDRKVVRRWSEGGRRCSEGGRKVVGRRWEVSR